MSELQAGWARPAQSRKWHYFPAHELRAICGNWLFGGEREDGYDDHADNCAACRRKVATLRIASASAAARTVQS